MGAFCSVPDPNGVDFGSAPKRGADGSVPNVDGAFGSVAPKRDGLGSIPNRDCDFGESANDVIKGFGSDPKTVDATDPNGCVDGGTSKADFAEPNREFDDGDPNIGKAGCFSVVPPKVG
uniref:Uncharacterized protein n=1 Tax=Photinus pyralis TaxID=7054 RepID=A0A1Y1LS99_PHOPY